MQKIKLSLKEKTGIAKIESREIMAQETCKLLEVLIVVGMFVIGVTAEIATITGFHFDNPIVVGEEPIIIVIGDETNIQTFVFYSLLCPRDQVFDPIVVAVRTTLLSQLIFASSMSLRLDDHCNTNFVFRSLHLVSQPASPDRLEMGQHSLHTKRYCFCRCQIFRYSMSERSERLN